jgi:hypothetical protein
VVDGVVTNMLDRTEQVAMPLLRAVATAAEMIRRTGPERIELVTITRDRLSLQPTELADGRQIAQLLGLDLPLDHRMFEPGHTLWTGEVHDLEVQVRSVLRRPVESDR